MDRAEFHSLRRMLKKYLPRKHREWFDSRMQHANDPSLNQRLKQLADRLGPVAEQLVGDVTVWGRVVSTCRNDLTHLEGLGEQYDSGDMYWLAEGPSDGRISKPPPSNKLVHFMAGCTALQVVVDY